MRGAQFFFIIALLTGCAGPNNSGPVEDSVTIDPRSTAPFQATSLRAWSNNCGGNGPATVNIELDGNSPGSLLNISILNQAPVVGQTYQLSQPQPVSSQSIPDLFAELGGTTLRMGLSSPDMRPACLTDCPSTIDPELPVSGSLLFSQVGMQDGSPIAVQFSASLYSGRILQGSLTTTLQVSNDCTVRND